MDCTVAYAVNSEKTVWLNQSTDAAAMTANIAYALNPEKGTVRRYQTALNLDSIETAWTEMRMTKERWGKTDGIQGFHVIQSFAPGEVEPDVAHRIGVEFAEKCFPGFEVVVGTHLDKQHIHNHIVINSVSCLDGHKYHSSQKSYYGKLRKVSDELCRRQGLSIIRPSEQCDKRKSYGEWRAEQEGRSTWCSAIRQDVDAAIASSLSFEQFVRQLRGMGYEVKTNVKHIAVRPPGKERFTRLRRLGDDYTEEALRKRILKNDPENMPPPADRQTENGPQIRRVRYRGSWKKSKKSKVGGLRGLYLWYAFRMGNIQKGGISSHKTHYLLREDIRKLEKRERMAALLVKNHIDSIEQLHIHRDECKKMIAMLSQERSRLWQRKESETVNSRLEEIKVYLKVLRREVRICDEIEEDSLLLEQKRKALRQHSKEKQQSKPTPRRDLQRDF